MSGALKENIVGVQFGVHIGPQNASMDQLRNLWRWLDTTSIDWISTWDHLYEAPPAGGTQPHFEAVATLGAMAADTCRVRLGCLVFCSQYRNVGVLMKAAATIDELSHGRFEMGMGSGWHDQEAHAFGLHFPGQGERFEHLESFLQAIVAWKSNDRISLQSKGVSLSDAAMVPSLRSSMPLWIGGTGPKKTLRMAGAYATGWNAAYVTPDDFRNLNTLLDEWCTKAGRQPTDVERSVNLSYALSSQDPAVVRTQLEAQWGVGATRIIGGSLLGRPSDAMEQIAGFVAAGAQLVNIAIRPPWDQEILADYIENIVPQMQKEWA